LKAHASRGSEYDRGTGCGKTARPGLCGGCRVTGIPTAELKSKREMKIYPKEYFEIESPLPAAEILAVLDAVVEPPKWFRWKAASGKKFFGEVSTNSFKIWKIISYRNSFLPIIEGRITPTISGSHIAVTLRLHRFVALFMLFWLGGVSTGLVTFVTEVMRGKTGPLPLLLVPSGMLLFGIAMTSGCFWWEAKKTKPALIELLKGVERQPTPA
jgi:hypothetical protein